MNWGGYGAVTQMITGAKTATATAAIAAVSDMPLRGRAAVEICNMDASNIVYIGPEGVSVASGIPIFPKTSRLIALNPAERVQIYMITTASVDVRIAEYLN